MRAATDDLAFAPATFRHEALFFAGHEEFVQQAVPFVREGVEAGEAVLVIVTADKTVRLRDALGQDAEQVKFEEMESVGRNPARIMPVWLEFVAGNHPGRGCRGIGEPVWAGRSADELIECERHEALLNLAFSDSPPWRLVCPYDTDSLDRAVLADAERTHPYILGRDGIRRSSLYGGLDMAIRPFDHFLPEPEGPVVSMTFDRTALQATRRFVAEQAGGQGLVPDRVDDFVLAVNEVVTNSLRHGGGEGVLRLWSDDNSLVCEVRDRGQIAEPLVGRKRPSSHEESGVGLWLVNHLCDLVQVRTFESGTVVRLHIRRS